MKISFNYLYAISAFLFLSFSEYLMATGMPYSFARVSKGNGYEIVLSFRLTNVPDEDFAGLGPSPIGSNATAPRLLIKYLDVCLSETEVNCDDGVKYKLRYNGDASIDQTPQLNQLNGYDIVITSTATVREFGFNHVDAVYTIRNLTKEAVKGFQNGTWYLSLSYKVNEVFQNAFLVKQASVPNRAPLENTVATAHKGLLATWQPIIIDTNDTANSDKPLGIDYLDGEQGMPTSVSIWTFKDETFGQELQMKRLFDEASPNTQSATTFGCTISDNGDGTCNLNCPTITNQDYAYMDKDLILSNASINENEQFYFSESPVSDSSAILTGLDPSDTYAVILQYEQSGVVQSSCLTGQPSLDRIFTELTSGTEPEVGNPNCFIATASYGTAQEEKINSLRWFRDNYLLKTSIGKKFVAFYYEKSPKIADVIRDNSLLKASVRFALSGPIAYVETLRTNPITTLFFSFLLLFSIPFICMTLIYKKRAL